MLHVLPHLTAWEQGQKKQKVVHLSTAGNVRNLIPGKSDYRTRQCQSGEKRPVRLSKSWSGATARYVIEGRDCPVSLNGATAQ